MLVLCWYIGLLISQNAVNHRFLDITCAVFVSSVVMYSSLPGVDVAHKLHWNPGEMVSHSASSVPNVLCCLIFVLI